MTAPAVPTVNFGGKRHYIHPVSGEVVPSVTSVLSMIGKGDGLMRWAAKEAAEYMKANPDANPNKAVFAADTIRDDAAAKGDHVHGIFEQLANGETPQFAQPDMLNSISGVVEWWERFQPEPLYAEATIWNQSLGYAGSFDLLAYINGVLTLIDLKTGKRTYPEMAIQLGAYGKGEELIHATPGGEGFFVKDMPKVEAYGILHAPAEGPWQYIPADVGDLEWAAFVAARGLFTWQAKRHKDALGAPVREPA